MADTLDFDRFWGEMQGEATSPALRIRVDGQEYELPPSLPAVSVLAHMRGEARSNKDVIAAGDALFGRGVMDGWARRGMGFDQMRAVVFAAERLVMGESPEEILGSAGSEESEGKGKRRAST